MLCIDHYNIVGRSLLIDVTTELKTRRDDVPDVEEADESVPKKLQIRNQSAYRR